MSNSLYAKGKEGLLTGQIDWDTDDIRIAALSAGYTPNLATHQYVNDLGANIVARSSAIAGATGTSGVATHTAKVVSAVTGAAITRLAYYKYNASDAGARLICLIDTATGSPGLPITPNGGDIVITPPGGGVFAL